MVVPRTIRVVAAVIERGGRYLITQRRASAGFAAVLGVSRRAGQARARATPPLLKRWKCYFASGRRHPDGAIDELREPPVRALTWWSCTWYGGTLIEGEPSAVNVSDFRWVASNDFDSYSFTPADEASMTKLLAFRL